MPVKIWHLSHDKEKSLAGVDTLDAAKTRAYDQTAQRQLLTAGAAAAKH